MSTKLDQLKDKLRELFQLDRPDLDFGFYRIMHAKQDEIDHFLDHDLLPQVQAGLATLTTNPGNAELAEAIKQAQALGVDPKTAPKVRELQEKWGAPVDPAKTEDAIYSHLYRFFSRYYDSGDFISMRRYKEGVYAIPYEGEEVMLHWANKDQYYIKSSENLRDYSVKLAGGDDAPRLHFKLVEADIEKDNRKAADDKKRVFIFNPDKTEVLENEIALGFEYRADTDGRKQETLIAECVDYVKSHTADFGPLVSRLLALKPTDKNKDRTLLEKHLSDYTSKNSMDYFIHKDLGGFLRRELDFYIKNEVMHLDDIENETAPRVEQYLAQVRVIRGIARKLIDFLAQLEDFQKKLWLKKKFVVETNYCITLDRVPEELYPAIAANDAQWSEWDKLGFLTPVAAATDRKSDAQLPLDPKSPPPKRGTVEYLKANPYLVLDTAFFDSPFKQKLLASIENIDEQCDGLLIHSENFQALHLLQERYREQVKCVYIDPPYNTSENAFLYKNTYKHSSWLSMMANGLGIAPSLMPKSGILMGAIDDTEYSNLKTLLSYTFGDDNYVGTIAVEVNPAGQNIRPNVPARSHDYFHIFAKRIDAIIMILRGLTPDEQKQYTEKDSIGQFYWDNLRRRGGNSRPTDRPKQWFPLYVNAQKLRVPEMEWSNSDKKWIVKARPQDDETEIWPIDPKGEKRIWRVNPDGARSRISSGDISVIDKAGRQEVSLKSREPEGKKPKTLWSESKHSATSHGTKLLLDILGSGLHFSYPKSIHLTTDAIRYWADETAIVLDFFAGSGTTGHSVLNLNREDSGSRKFILVEMGGYFESTLKPRIQKVVYSKDWKDGKPTAPETGISHCFKYVRLESYEDCLNNLELKRTAGQDDLLNRNQNLKEDYTLRYMLDVESRDSLLNPAAFADPFSCKLNISTGSVGETKPTTVDLVETFNYLIGLKVRTMDTIRGVQVITGENLAGEKILVLWRKVAETDSEALNQWFVKQGYNTQDMEFDIIYVNGDNFLENLRKDEQTWKVRLTEEEFLRRMFNEEGV